ncbi:MAG: c-type cytochrome [Alphaproteobacteria bacterium]
METKGATTLKRGREMLRLNLVALTTALAFSVAAGEALAAGDVAAGEKVYNSQCKACHSLDKGKNGVGPSLSGIVGSKAGAVAGFKYSDAMTKAGITWDDASLAKFLKSPKDDVPGTKMLAGALKSDDDIQNVIAFLKEKAK